ncbi:Uncharacterised protein [Vibrio cholerae]|nr:Uncharacterised protein [Vibrio cholerae]CSI47932.1 Uncharacterised protein [Vibrio cholerae]
METDTTGLSISGISRTASLVKETTPNTHSNILSTNAATGRFTDTSDNHIICHPSSADALLR